MCSCDGNQAEAYWSRIVKARVEHWCSECRDPIRLGDRYIRNQRHLGRSP